MLDLDDIKMFNNSGNLQHYMRYIRHPNELLANYRRWHDLTISQHPFIFLLGPPRSGTTLLQTLLLAHSNITGIAEETSIISPKSIHDPNRFKCFLNASAHQTILSQTTGLADFFEAVHSEVLGSSFRTKAYTVEKTPQHVKYLDFILQHFPHSKVVHILRDGRDTFCSGRSARNIPQARSVETHAKYWASCIKARLAQHSEYVHDLTYEDLTSNPKEELNKVMSFLELEFEPDQLDMSKRSGDMRARQKAFERLNASISNSTVGRWKNEMSNNEKEIYIKYAGKQLSFYGYEA